MSNTKLQIWTKLKNFIKLNIRAKIYSLLMKKEERYQT